MQLDALQAKNQLSQKNRRNSCGRDDATMPYFRVHIFVAKPVSSTWMEKLELPRFSLQARRSGNVDLPLVGQASSLAQCVASVAQTGWKLGLPFAPRCRWRFSSICSGIIPEISAKRPAAIQRLRPLRGWLRHSKAIIEQRRHIANLIGVATGHHREGISPRLAVNDQLP